MYQRKAAGLTIALEDTLNNTITWRKECHPIATNQQVGCIFLQTLPHSHPIQRITGVYFAYNIPPRRSQLLAILCLTREQETGILQRESHHLHLMTFCHKLLGQSFVERCQSASVRPRCAYYCYSHGWKKFVSPTKVLLFFDIAKHFPTIHTLSSRFISIICILYTYSLFS